MIVAKNYLYVKNTAALKQIMEGGAEQKRKKK